MPEEDIYVRRDADAALRTAIENRNELVKFYKNLATVSTQKLSRELKDEESKSTAMADAEKMLEAKIKDFCAKAPVLSKEEIDVYVGRLCIAMFLTDRARTLKDLVMINNRLALYSLFASLRNRIFEVLAESYYSKTTTEVLGDYASIEPIITACSEVCGLPQVSIKDIVFIYRKKLADRVEDFKG
jgi:hypothetical protein